MTANINEKSTFHTTVDLDNGKVRCPVCRNATTVEVLERSKLGLNDLASIDELLRNNQLMHVIEVGRVAAKFFKPDTLSAEIQLHDSLMKLSDRATELMDKQKQVAIALTNASEEKRARITQEAMTKQQEIITRFQCEISRLEQDHKYEISQMNSTLQQIQHKISGVGIGEVRQTTVIKDLKSSCPSDDFSDEKARKAGTDILAKVIDNRSELGKIVVSVKEVEKWSSDFVEQIRKNMNEEHTEWGILVTKAFPSSALNERLYFDSINGILVVKAECVAAAYAGLRHCVKFKHQSQNWIKSHQESTGLQQQIVNILQNWVNGEELKKLLASIDEANAAATQADDVLQKLQAHNEKQLKTTRELADKVRKSMQNCTLMLTELREKLPLDG